jgi:hypothetical protein
MPVELRGGDFDYYSASCRASYKSFMTLPSGRDDIMGFRFILTEKTLSSLEVSN